MINLKLLRYLAHHPLNRRTRFRSIHNILFWNIATKLMPGCEIIVPFANHSRLIVTPGRWGSEANAFCGLHEFADMGFLMHLLRPDDLFCDVGANVGTYTILASSAVGAKTLAFEPIESSFIELKKNIDINRLGSLVDARQMAVGKAAGRLMMTHNNDTMNHVISVESSDTDKFVTVDTLDSILSGHTPLLLKIDVEGWEHEVLHGGMDTLRNPNLKAVIIELNGSGDRYGFSDESTHSFLINLGFSPYQYQPFDRQLTELGGMHNTSGNTLYIRNIEFVEQRLRNAPPFSVRDFVV